jgi:NAD+ kinase
VALDVDHLPAPDGAHRARRLRAGRLKRLGLIVHPSRPLEGVLATIASWAAERGLETGQVRIDGQTREVAEPVQPGDCELLIAVGGDGTTLAALHEGARSSVPVLGIACGSVGALTSVSADEAAGALEAIAAERWAAQELAGLEVTWRDGSTEFAINDFVAIRKGAGQVQVSVSVDEVLYAQVAGDGLVVATAVGSSAYTMAAGGPVLAPGAEGLAVTPLAPHGGSCPPLVAGPGSRLAITVEPGYGGVRYEIDGRRVEADAHEIAIGLRPAYATLVRLHDTEPRLTGLRRRGLVLDSPRVLIREARLHDIKLPGVPPSG